MSASHGAGHLETMHLTRLYNPNEEALAPNKGPRRKRVRVEIRRLWEDSSLLGVDPRTFYIGSMELISS